MDHASESRNTPVGEQHVAHASVHLVGPTQRVLRAEEDPPGGHRLPVQGQVAVASQEHWRTAFAGIRAHEVTALLPGHGQRPRRNHRRTAGGFESRARVGWTQHHARGG